MDSEQPGYDYAVIVSLLAVQDLSEITAFIAADNPAAADHFVQELVQRTRTLGRFPELSKVVLGLAGQGDARELVHRSYRIIYRVDHRRRLVEIARFWHAARGKPWL